MDNSDKELFRSTGKISKQLLTAIYGDLLPGDLVLKFAELKDFDAARAAFNEWDEDSKIEMDSFLTHSYHHKEELYRTRDKFIAMNFLIKLINEWELSLREQIRVPQLSPDQLGQADELFTRRLAGKLPSIEIDGIDFTIDWRLRELRETEFPWNKIDLNELRESESGKEYLGLYDTKEKKLYDFDDRITILPQNVVGLEIPHEVKLDPVAVAREHGLIINQFVQLNPIVKDLKAFIRPITETGLPEMVEENLRKAREISEDQNSKRKIGR